MASLRASATLAFFMPARAAKRMAQLLSAPALTGRVRMMCAGSDVPKESLMGHRRKPARPKPAKPHQLRNTTCVLAVGLDRHGLERITHDRTFGLDNANARLFQRNINPAILRQWSSLNEAWSRPILTPIHTIILKNDHANCLSKQAHYSCS